MKKIDFWIRCSLLNLCIVALLGTTLRTKFLFPIPFIDYKNFLSAHSHFAFGGWVTLALMALCIDGMLPAVKKEKKIYGIILWGIQLSSWGMLFTFPFTGYAFLSILFSTLFIFFSYLFSWQFARDIMQSNATGPVKLLSVAAVVSLAVSSVGPFTLAYIMASHSGDAILFRDALYTYLHFQYNGYFTLTVMALFFHHKTKAALQADWKKIRIFSILLTASVIPSLFLTLLWHGQQTVIRLLAYLGCILIFATLISFFTLLPLLRKRISFQQRQASVLLTFSLISFCIKMLLETGTIIPSLAHAVFGYRPVIIGFLHLVFLGLVSFYILSNYIERKVFASGSGAGVAIAWFSFAIIFNELILLIEGLGLIMGYAQPIYGWLLWIAAILLFTGAILLYRASKTGTAETTLELAAV